MNFVFFTFLVEKKRHFRAIPLSTFYELHRENKSYKLRGSIDSTAKRAITHAQSKKQVEHSCFKKAKEKIIRKLRAIIIIIIIIIII